MEAECKVIVDASIIPAEDYPGMEKIIVRYADSVVSPSSIGDWEVLKTFYEGEISILPWMLTGKTKDEALDYISC